MKKIQLCLALGLLITFATTNVRGQWSDFRIPRIICGGSTGFFRVSLDNFSTYYNSRWGNYHTGQVSVRVYRGNYLTVQYGRFQKTADVNTQLFSGKAEWNERLINLGIRWYAETEKRWRFYSGFGFVFVKVEEKPGLLLKPETTDDVSTNGSGFFLEIGADYIIFPHIALNLELEASSAGEGGTPGIIGSSIGGYAFLAGLNFHF